MRKYLWLVLLSATTLLFSCNNEEIGNGKDVDPQSIYFDYKIWGSEEDSNVTVVLQYRFAGPRGTTLVLEEPSNVKLDGQLIPVDSSKMTGAFYEMIYNARDFAGQHSIVYTDINKKEYKEDFHFFPLVLKTAIPAEVKRENLLLDLEGLATQEKLRIILTDTSRNDGINRKEWVTNGSLLITAEDLNTLANGPIFLEIYKESENPVLNGTEEGGLLSITYGLKRNFVLGGNKGKLAN